MTDIVERLRQRDEYEQVLDHENLPYGLVKSLAHDAADEIERLRAERDEAQAEANAGRQAEHDADVERRAVEAERDRLREAILDTEQHDAGLVPMRLRLLALKETGHG